ncbi:MAG: phosphoribosyl-ATP diphosphatase [Gemmatimonadaceae bacterium]|nr:phosphoribosyl-ATP diphosphatase [Gemmatimonadaceae bacterium]
MSTLDLDSLAYDERGLVTVVTQDAVSGVVLMVAHASRDALEWTVETGEMHYLSRTRGLWRKGATSGATQRVVSLTADCDSDAVLARVVPAGPACHDGTISCFGDEVRSDALSVLDATVQERAGDSSDSSGSYTRVLVADRNLRTKKLGEECAELVMALSEVNAAAAVEEAADLLYHIVVALRGVGVGWSEVRGALAARALNAA